MYAGNQLLFELFHACAEEATRDTDITLECIWVYHHYRECYCVAIFVTVHTFCCVYVCVCVCSDVLKNCTVPFAQHIHMHKGVWTITRT